MKTSFILFLIIVFIIAFWVGQARADPQSVSPSQPNPDTFMYQGESLIKYNDADLTLRKTGEWHWFYSVNPVCSGDISQAVSSAITELQSVFAISFIYDYTPSSSSHKIYANCGTAFSAICGGGGVIGCLGHGFPYNNDIDLSTDMAVYYDLSQTAIVLHEMFHALATFNEQYKLDGSFSTSPGWIDIMNTGPESRHHVAATEIERWDRVHGPNSLKIVGVGRNDGGFYVYWCNLDTKATRVSILYDDGYGSYWSGIITSPVPDRNNCQGQWVQESGGRCYLVKQENPISWSTSYTEVKAGCL